MSSNKTDNFFITRFPPFSYSAFYSHSGPPSICCFYAKMLSGLLPPLKIKKPVSYWRNRLFVLRGKREKSCFFGSPAVLFAGPMALCPPVPQGLPFRKHTTALNITKNGRFSISNKTERRQIVNRKTPGCQNVPLEKMPGTGLDHWNCSKKMLIFGLYLLRLSVKVLLH